MSLDPDLCICVANGFKSIIEFDIDWWLSTFLLSFYSCDLE